MSDWLTADEAAIPLRTIPATVTRMAKDGQFTRVKWVGNRVRIHRDELYPPASSPTTASDPGPAHRLLEEIEWRIEELRKMVSPPAILSWEERNRG